MNIISKIFFLLVECSISSMLNAQTVRHIEVREGESYTDHISIGNDSKDMDIIVKFIFDESKNTLAVNLISYRNLFVFREDVRYSQVIRRHKLKQERLPYVVTAEPGSKYKLTKSFRKSVSNPKRKHIFRKWVSYEGLQPAPTEYKMVNDYIEQTFGILNKDTMVNISLHDILIMDLASNSLQKGKKYHFVYKKNLDRTYKVTIRRNPCFGKEDEIDNAKQSLKSIASGYQSLRERYGHAPVQTQEEINLFKEMQELLLNQFPSKNMNNPCPDIQEQWNTYNLYRDSIQQMNVILPANKQHTDSSGVDADYMLSQARMIDENVAKWMSTHDKIERRDLEEQCLEIIQSTSNLVAKNGLYDAKQKQAMAIFHRAERYFRANCQQMKRDSHE